VFTYSLTALKQVLTNEVAIQRLSDTQDESVIQLRD